MDVARSGIGQTVVVLTNGSISKYELTGKDCWTGGGINKEKGHPLRDALLWDVGADVIYRRRKR